MNGKTLWLISLALVIAGCGKGGEPQQQAPAVTQKTNLPETEVKTPDAQAERPMIAFAKSKVLEAINEKLDLNETGKAVAKLLVDNYAERFQRSEDLRDEFNKILTAKEYRAIWGNDEMLGRYGRTVCGLLTLHQDKIRKLDKQDQIILFEGVKAAVMNTEVDFRQEANKVIEQVGLVDSINPLNNAEFKAEGDLATPILVKELQDALKKAGIQLVSKNLRPVRPEGQIQFTFPTRGGQQGPLVA